MPDDLNPDDLSTLDRGDAAPAGGDDQGAAGGTDDQGAADGTDDKGASPGDSLDVEGEETPEERAAREAEEAEREKAKRIRIPKARLDEAVAKARQREEALNNKIAELQNQLGTRTTQTELSKAQAKIESLQDQYEELILDGKKDEARAVRRQVEALRDELIDYRTAAKSEAARKAAIDDLKYESTLANIESQHAALNPDSEQFDPDKTDEVAVLMEAFVARGFQRAAALSKAVQYVMGPASKQTSIDEAAAVAQRRATEARRKAAEANARQPASTKDIGLDSDKGGTAAPGGIDVMRLTQDRFAKLDDETKAKLRGDEM